jgi:FAD/FMN-containing dehydrogenase
MGKEWVNWSGSVKFTPETIEKPGNEEEVRQLVIKALSEQKEIRIVGAGHSSVPLVETNRVLISQENLKGLINHDKEKLEVEMFPGTSISEAGEILVKLRVNMHNTGDVDFQCLGGAFGTGTHGSGKTLGNLPTMMVGCRLVDGNGQVREYSLDKDPEMIRALRVSLGALGFFTALTIKTEQAQKFYRYEFCTHIETCLENLDELMENNRMFDFYWYPRSDEAKIRICNPLGEGTEELPYATKVKEEFGWLSEILPKKRELKYEEMEYAIPLEAGPECFKEIRERVKEKHRQYVGWRVLFRTIAADDALLSPFYKRDSVTIACLQNSELEYKKYFNDIEPVFNSYGGRPHWGKKHSLRADELKQLYPEWERFLQIRKEMDPNGIFLNSYLKEIFGL